MLPTNYDVNLVSTWIATLEGLPGSSEVPLILQDYLSKRFAAREQRVKVSGGKVRYIGKSVNLSSHKKILALFKTIARSPSGSASKEELIASIYGFRDSSRISVRQRLCREHNIVKLISRARKLADSKLTPDSTLKKTRWLPYDPCAKTWSLVRNDI